MAADLITIRIFSLYKFLSVSIMTFLFFDIIVIYKNNYILLIFKLSMIIISIIWFLQVTFLVTTNIYKYYIMIIYVVIKRSINRYHNLKPLEYIYIYVFISYYYYNLQIICTMVKMKFSYWIHCFEMISMMLCLYFISIKIWEYTIWFNLI